MAYNENKLFHYIFNIHSSPAKLIPVDEAGVEDCNAMEPNAVDFDGCPAGLDADYNGYPAGLDAAYNGCPAGVDAAYNGYSAGLDAAYNGYTAGLDAA